MKTIGTFLCVGVVIICASVLQADEGFPDPISIDRESPSVVTFGNTVGDIYDWVGPPGMGHDVGGPGPIVHVKDVTYGLNRSDNNDGHSNGETVEGQYQNLSIYFSGHDNRSLSLGLSGDVSMGLPNTDYLNQAVRNQAAGDRYMLNGMTTQSPAAVMAGLGPSGVTPPVFPGGNNNFPINLLSANQTNYNEIPTIPPIQFNNVYAPNSREDLQDDMDALELTAFDLSGDRIHNTPIFFSLDNMSPGLLGPTPSGADIYLSPPGAPGYYVFAESPQLGLDLNAAVNQRDEVDALVIWSINGDQVVPGLDHALFSLAPSSPTLWGVDMAPGIAGVDDDGLNGPDDLGEVGFGDDMSPADIFVTDFSGTFQLYLKANTIGMRRTDNVDALDVEVVEDVSQIQEPIDSFPGSLDPKFAGTGEMNGDFNLDGIVNVSDLGILATNYGKLSGMKWATGDANGDEGVNVTDLGILATNYGTVTVAGAAVPEPSTAIVLLTGLAGLLLFRRR